MSCPCTDYLDIGCIDSCGAWTLVNAQGNTVNADESGVHTLRFWQFGSWKKIEFSGTSATPIVIPDVMNERAESYFKILTPDGDNLEMESKDCFRVTSRLVVNLNTVTTSGSESVDLFDSQKWVPATGTEFTVTETIPTGADVFVYRNGLLKIEDTHYTRDGQTFDFTLEGALVNETLVILWTKL